MKVKKCLKWTLVTATILAVVAWAVSSLGEHRERFGRDAAGRHGIPSGNWMMQSPNVHAHFYHGGSYVIGLAVIAVLCGLVLLSVLLLVRKIRVKHCYRLASLQQKHAALHDMVQQPSLHGQFLDKWEKNLTSIKEETTHGNL